MITFTKQIYMCFCGKLCVTPETFVQHQNSHHVVQTTPQTFDLPVYMCTTCRHNFSTAADCEAHEVSTAADCEAHEVAKHSADVKPPHVVNIDDDEGEEGEPVMPALLPNVDKQSIGARRTTAVDMDKKKPSDNGIDVTLAIAPSGSASGSGSGSTGRQNAKKVTKRSAVKLSASLAPASKKSKQQCLEKDDGRDTQSELYKPTTAENPNGFKPGQVCLTSMVNKDPLAPVEIFSFHKSEKKVVTACVLWLGTKTKTHSWVAVKRLKSFESSFCSYEPKRTKDGYQEGVVEAVKKYSESHTLTWRVCCKNYVKKNPFTYYAIFGEYPDDHDESMTEKMFYNRCSTKKKRDAATSSSTTPARESNDVKNK